MQLQGEGGYVVIILFQPIFSLADAHTKSTTQALLSSQHTTRNTNTTQHQQSWRKRRGESQANLP